MQSAAKVKGALMNEKQGAVTSSKLTTVLHPSLTAFEALCGKGEESSDTYSLTLTFHLRMLVVDALLIFSCLCA